MKKIFTLLLAGALISVLAVACDNEGGSGQRELNENEIQLVQASNEVTEFFDENLSQIAHAIFDEYDEEYEVWKIRRPFVDSCVMINSVSEYRQIDFRGEPAPELPAIDFDSHTLVIGQYAIPQGGYTPVSQSIDTESDVMELKLVLENTHKGLTAEFYPSCWGVYPKLPQKPIIMDVTDNE